MSYAERMTAQCRILARVAEDMNTDAMTVLPIVAAIFAQLFPNSESLA